MCVILRVSTFKCSMVVVVKKICYLSFYTSFILPTPTHDGDISPFGFISPPYRVVVGLELGFISPPPRAVMELARHHFFSTPCCGGAWTASSLSFVTAASVVYKLRIWDRCSKTYANTFNRLSKGVRIFMIACSLAFAICRNICKFWMKIHAGIIHRALAQFSSEHYTTEGNRPPSVTILAQCIT